MRLFNFPYSVQPVKMSTVKNDPCLVAECTAIRLLHSQETRSYHIAIQMGVQYVTIRGFRL